MRILLPKAQREQARWQRAIGDSAAVTMIDPWNMTLRPESESSKQCWMNLDQYQGVIAVSPTAADVIAQALDQYWPMPPVGVHWLCNGPRTADVLRQAQLRVVYPESGYTAEHVMALPEAQTESGHSWLIVKGDGGRDVMAQTLRQRGARVTEQIVYQREIDSQALQAMATAAEQCQVIWLSSEYLGQALLNDQPEVWLSWPGQWWVSSSRLATWANAQGLWNVYVAGGADVVALQSAIQQQNEKSLQ